MPQKDLLGKICSHSHPEMPAEGIEYHNSWFLLLERGYQTQCWTCCGFPQLILGYRHWRHTFNYWYNCFHPYMGYVVESHNITASMQHSGHYPSIIDAKPCVLSWRSLYWHFCTLLSRNLSGNTLQDFKKYNFYLFIQYNFDFSGLHMEPAMLMSRSIRGGWWDVWWFWLVVII